VTHELAAASETLHAQDGDATPSCFR
jgi:hypothetical protein